MIKEGDRVRLVTDVTGDDGVRVIPAGTVGIVVDALHAPDEYAVDVRLGDQFDNIAVSADQLEPATA